MIPSLECHQISEEDLIKAPVRQKNNDQSQAYVDIAHSQTPTVNR